MQTSNAERAALAGRVVCWHDGREILVATLSGHIAAYPVSTGVLLGRAGDLDLTRPSKQVP